MDTEKNIHKESGHPHGHSHKNTQEHAHGHSHCCSGGHCHTSAGRGTLADYAAPAISFIMLITGILMSHFNAGWFGNDYVRLAWYVAAFLPVGIPVIREAVEGIAAKDVFNEFTLMTIACIGAFCIKEYPEAVGVMLFYSVGEKLQDGAVGRATRDITRLLDVRSRQANVLRDGKTVAVDPSSVKVGETIRVIPGERVPLDGELDGCDGLFDTSALTGESVPRDVQDGGEVLAGMICESSPVTIRVTREYDKSALAKILDLVKNASSRKAHAELFIRKFARVYTPVVIALAALLVIVPAIVGMLSPSFHYVFSDWLYRALVFLVISCPCALVISVPLGYYAGIGAASRQGILFKGGNYLEAITHVTTVAFDKTGTLTTGRFHVTDVYSPLMPRETLLSLMAAVESQSTHPLAKALVAYAEQEGVAIPSPSGLTEIPGHGVKATVDGKEVAAGNSRLMAMENVAMPGKINDGDGTVILCAVGGKFAGYAVLADTLKPDSRQAVERLRALGVKDIVMLSGDRQTIADSYARKLGISKAYGDLLPQGKAEYVEKMSARPGESIAFVGDGMNDAPVLAVSNVGIAMGGLGSDAAIESADVVIQTDQPSKVATAVRIGRVTHKIVMENIIGAIAIKVVILALGAIGFASLWAAVFADVGVALLAVLNSMRILWGHRRWNN